MSCARDDGQVVLHRDSLAPLPFLFNDTPGPRPLSAFLSPPSFLPIFLLAFFPPPAFLSYTHWFVENAEAPMASP